jgi:transmembrane sensor
LADRVQRQSRIAEEAAEWLLRLESGSLSSEERAGFVDWLRESPHHVAEMLRVAKLHNALAKFGQWDLLPAGGLSASEDLPVDVLRRAVSEPAPVAKWPWALAACVALVAASWGWYTWTSGAQTIRTQLGERREMALADGSEVALAPGSEIRVEFSGTRRLIRLGYGEAFFHVGKDANRPFLVASAHAQARALGTSFSVAERADAAVVTVTEGKVAVSANTGRSAETPGTDAQVALSTNQQVTVSVRGTAPVRQIDGRVELAWSQGQLVFDNETVADVVLRFNHYNQMKIRVTDAALAARPVSGVFRATDPESFVAFLESVAGAKARKNGAEEMLIESSSAAQPEVLPR